MTTGDAAPPSPHGDAMAPPRQRNSERATTAGGSPRAGAPASLDDALRRIDALEAENEALAAEIGALKKSATARADAARRADGSSPSAGRARDRERSELEEPAFMTMTMTSLLARVRLLEEREAARVPILERFVEEAPDVFNRHVLPRLDDGDLAVLAMVNQKMREFVFASPVGDVRDVAAVRRQLARVRNFVGSVGRMAWAKERGCPWDKDTFECIAEFGNVEVAKWAKERGCVSELDVHPDLCYKAASGGQLEMLQWLRANGAPWDGFRWNEKTCAVAAEGGHLEVLQWARANGAPWDYMTCAHAARGGHLEVLQWARANGAPWDESTCAYAAEGGHLEVLQWARANGAPWNKETCYAAVEGGHLEVLKWARANGCPWDKKHCADRAVNRPEVFEWIRQSVPLTQKIEYLRSYEEKKSMLMDLVHAVKGLTLVFVETETGVDQLEDWLSREGFPSTSIHGYRTQQVREYALNSFRSGRTPILVTTDVATLGLDDVPHVSHVINFDLPSNIDGYVHRIGLTARAGNKGLATAFFTDKDAGLARPLRRILSEEVQEVPDFLYKFISYPKGWSWLDDSLK